MGGDGVVEGIRMWHNCELGVKFYRTCKLNLKNPVRKCVCAHLLSDPYMA